MPPVLEFIMGVFLGSTFIFLTIMMICATILFIKLAIDMWNS